MSSLKPKSSTIEVFWNTVGILVGNYEVPLMCSIWGLRAITVHIKECSIGANWGSLPFQELGLLYRERRRLIWRGVLFWRPQFCDTNTVTFWGAPQISF